MSKLQESEKRQIKKLFLQVAPALVSFGAATFLIKYYGD